MSALFVIASWLCSWLESAEHDCVFRRLRGLAAGPDPFACLLSDKLQPRDRTKGIGHVRHYAVFAPLDRPHTIGGWLRRGNTGWEFNFYITWLGWGLYLMIQGGLLYGLENRSRWEKKTCFQEGVLWPAFPI